MSQTISSSKICVHHLERRAVVYLRQSSDKQVRDNLESQRLQYGLKDRALDLGWQQVEVVDSDLGASAAMGSARREGFERVIAAVATSQVGIVFSREASRLSRTDGDWCRLLEVCQVFDTLIGDDERVYDLGSMDDQLVLGIKATMSVVELRVMQTRMREGAEAKARRGELERMLPPGYVRDSDNRVVRDPDTRVQEAMSLVFAKFAELWSVRQTFLWFHNEGIELPVNKKRNGRMQIVWQLPTLSFVHNVLHNPFYAGAFVWGQRQTRAVLDPETGRVRKRMTSLLPPEQCRVFIPGHHEGYIDWYTFEENQRLMRANGLKTNKDESVAAVRGGQGLLAGILRCGRCGRKMHVRYWGRSGTSARYLCKGDFESGGRYCLGMGGATVDRRFSEEILGVLSPLGVRASLEAMQRLQIRGQQRRRTVEKQLEQAEYEATRAFEQYDQVDARNRLVAAELETRWNAKLQEVDRLRDAVEGIDAEAATLTDRQRRELLALGECFGDTWESESCPVELKKKIIRTVVEEAIVNVDDEESTLRFVIHWKGGVHTRFTMPKPVSPQGRKTAAEDIDIIRLQSQVFGAELLPGTPVPDADVEQQAPLSQGIKNIRIQIRHGLLLNSRIRLNDKRRVEDQSIMPGEG